MSETNGAGTVRPARSVQVSDDDVVDAGFVFALGVGEPGFEAARSLGELDIFETEFTGVGGERAVEPRGSELKMDSPRVGLRIDQHPHLVVSRPGDSHLPESEGSLHDEIVGLGTAPVGPAQFNRILPFRSDADARQPELPLGLHLAKPGLVRLFEPADDLRPFGGEVGGFEGIVAQIEQFVDRPGQGGFAAARAPARGVGWWTLPPRNACCHPCRGGLKSVVRDPVVSVAGLPQPPANGLQASGLRFAAHRRSSWWRARREDEHPARDGSKDTEYKSHRYLLKDVEKVTIHFSADGCNWLHDGSGMSVEPGFADHENSAATGWPPSVIGTGREPSKSSREGSMPSAA